MGAIFFIRHGQASFNAADYDDLSPLGREQAQVLGGALKARRIRAQHFVCGGMRRHAQTAAECLAGMDRDALWDVDEGWNEYDHNELLAALDVRYKSQSELASDLLKHENPRRAFQVIFERAITRWTDGAYHDSYRESWPAFCARVEGALERTVARLGKSENALVFTSGGVISVVLRKLLGLGDQRTMLM
ncbi:MAG TPA: histidine phosphatase family protein, partial [Polyangiales bacterium]